MVLLTDKEADAVYLQVSKNFMEGDLTRAHEHAQHKAQLKKAVEWMLKYKDINLAEEISNDKTTVFFFPNDELQALLKEVE